MFALTSWIRVPIALALVMSAPYAPISADDLDNATIEGFVFDPAGAVIPDARVTVAEQQTGKKRTGLADAQGWYRIAALAAGTYAIQAESVGFASGEYKDIRLKSGQTLRQDFHLKIGSLTDAVVVLEAASPDIDTTRTVIGLTIDGLEMDRLPLTGRNPLDLIFLFANVQAEPFELRDLGDPASRDFIPDTPQEAGIFSLSGGRAYSNNITIDGFDNNDDRLARERTVPSLEAVAEVQIITNQFSAEYGRASGGRINFVTRRGNNEFHGAGFGDFQDESLNANSYFRNARGEKRQPFQRREYGGRLSGPILPNRLFFFGAYERRDEPDTDSIVALLPVDSKANPLYPLQETPTGRPFTRDGVQVALFEDELSTPGSRTVFTGKFDHTLTQNHNLTFRFDATLSNRLRARDQGATLAEGMLNRRRNSSAYAFQDNLVIGQKLVNQFRFQYSALTPRNTQADPRPGVIVGSSRGQSLAFASGFIAGASGFPETRAERRFQFADALSWQQGRHSLKLGADLMHLRSSTTQLNLFFGFYNFPSFGDFVAGAPSRFRQRIGQPEQLIVNNVFGVFVQDEWRVRPNLTLSAGLRYDRETLLDHDNNNFGPRVAFAWDPFRTSKTVIRGGLGVFYNRVLLRTFEDFAVQSHLFEIDLGTEPGATGKIENLNRIGGFPKVFPNDPMSPLVNDLIRPISNARSINPDLRIPYSLQSSLGVEREISRGFKLEVSYVLNRTLRLWRDSNINAPIPPRGGLAQFLLNPPEGFPGVVKLPDGKTAFDNSARQIVDLTTRFIQFDLGAARFRDVGSGANRVRVYGLNGQGGGTTTTDPVLAALNAVRFLRPNPLLGEVEQLQSDGQAAYHGLNLIVSKRFKRGHFVRASYTLSKLIDFVDLNTSSPQDEFNTSLERGLGRTDERHRFVVSGSLTLPKFFAGLEISPLMTLSSGRPFNITTNDQDRNLSDNSTDRPDFLGRGPIDYIRPGDTTRSGAMVSKFTFSTLGTNGTLGRNVGRGPGITRLDVRFSRRFRLGEKTKLQPWVNVYNLTNTPNFVMAGFIGPLDERSGDSVFLQPRATRRPRTIELGLRVEL